MASCDTIGFVIFTLCRIEVFEVSRKVASPARDRFYINSLFLADFFFVNKRHRTISSGNEKMKFYYFCFGCTRQILRPVISYKYGECVIISQNHLCLMADSEMDENAVVNAKNCRTLNRTKHKLTKNYFVL